MAAPLVYEIAHLIGGCVLLLSFALLSQRRLFGVLNVFALQAFGVAAAAGWQAYAQHAPHLYITAGIALVLKAIIVPGVLHLMIGRLGIHRAIEEALPTGATLLVGVGLVSLSILLVLPVTTAASALTREGLVIALSIVLLGLLMMIARRNAVSQVIGFMSLENGLVLGAVGVHGMPFVVEMSIAFSVLVAFLVFGMFFFRIRERFDTLDIDSLDRFRGERR